MKRVNFELHIDDDNLAKVKIIHRIIEAVELLNSDEDDQWRNPED